MDMETETAQVKVIAHIRSDFSTKFGIPRQSGLVDELTARIVFTPPYRSQAALRGLEGFSHLWLIWEFSKARREDWSPTVRPPRLGGNQRLGVFATRSPFRPNPIGLSCVRLAGIDLHTPEVLERVPEDKRAALAGVLSQDPRPSYQHDPERVYGMAFAGLEVRFQVQGDRLRVVSVEREP